MAAKADMHVESVNKGLHFISDTVAVGIPDSPQVRAYGHKDILAMLQDATCDVRQLGIEIPNVELGMVRHATALSIFQDPHLLLKEGQIAPVVCTILVTVGKPGVLITSLRGESSAQKFSPVFHRFP